MDQDRQAKADSVASAPRSLSDFGSRWARPLRVHLSVIIVLLLIALSIPLMWITFQEGRQAALTSAEQQMRLLSRSTIDLYDNVFRDGYSAITLGAVLPSLVAEPPLYLNAKREILVKALKGSPHLEGLYLGYPSGGFVQVMRAAKATRWAESVGAPEDIVFGMRVITKTPERSALSTWYFLDGNGRQIGAGPLRVSDYDPRRRPWYKAALEKREVVSTAPYISASTRALTLTLAVAPSGRPGIVVGADITLESIGEMLTEHAVSENSTGYVFDDGGKLIVHSNPVAMAELVEQLSIRTAGRRTFAANDDEIVSEIVARDELEPEAVKDDRVLQSVKALLAKTPVSPQGELVEISVEDTPWLVKMAPMGLDALHMLRGYTAVIASPVSDFTAQSLELLRQKLMAAGLFVVLGVILALFVSRRISRALVALAQDANQIGNLDFHSWKITRSLISEINMLGSSLTAARDAIHTFAIYVPRELVRKIVAAGNTAGAAERREVTVLFTDIRDFTTISEQHTPEEVVEMLGDYFETMNVIVERNNGVIVQYLGDSIYAMWNAPADNPDHVADGCRCALELRAAVDAFNARRASEGKPELVTRFGLHTGVAVVGSVGAEERRQYTAMGDTINVASRLEGMNKQFGTTILASGAVREKAGTAASFRPLGAASVKGRHEQIDVFELIGPADTGPEAGGQVAGAISTC